MNVLEVVFSLGIGGTERTAENFALGLNNCNNSVVVFSPIGGIREQNLLKNEIKVVHSFKELFILSKEWIADVIHFHFHGLDYSTVQHIKQIFPIALYCEHNVFATPTSFEKEMDISCQLSTWCTWNYVNRKISYRTPKVAIVPNPINTKSFFPVTPQERRAFREKYNIPDSSKILLRVGQPFEAKWNVKMIDIYRDLRKKHSDLILFCVGAPDYLKRKAIKLSKEEQKNILFIDKIVGDDNLRLCYGAADIFLHMTRIGESFGIVLAEAILSGLPVVTLQTPYADNSQSEIVGHNIGGLVANRYWGIYDSVNLLLENKELRQKLVRNGQKSIKQRFGLDNVIQEFVSVIDNKKGNESLLYSSICIDRYLNDAIDKSIPGVVSFFRFKRLGMRVMSERCYRYLFRMYCRIFDKAVQL